MTSHSFWAIYKLRSKVNQMPECVSTEALQSVKDGATVFSEKTQMAVAAELLRCRALLAKLNVNSTEEPEAIHPDIPFWNRLKAQYFGEENAS